MSDNLTMSSLKPCPFCHGLEDGKLIGEPIVEFQDGYVACNNLNCFIYYVETTKEAWNTRPTNDAKAMIADELSCDNSRCSRWDDSMMFRCASIDEEYHTRCERKTVRVNLVSESNEHEG